MSNHIGLMIGGPGHGKIATPHDGNTYVYPDRRDPKKDVAYERRFFYASEADGMQSSGEFLLWIIEDDAFRAANIKSMIRESRLEPSALQPPRA